MSIYDYEVRTISGEVTTLEPYRGKVLLIVNTASGCGLTPNIMKQYSARTEPEAIRPDIEQLLQQ